MTTDEAMEMLRAHSDKVVSERTRPIHISRSNVWTTALRQFSRPQFAESSDMLYVTFASDEDMVEDAADYGGPRREFFRLLVKAIIQDSGAFEGKLSCQRPSPVWIKVPIVFSVLFFLYAAAHLSSN